MTEQTQKLTEALRGCAERGISPTTEPWREIRERLDAREAAPARRRLVPRTRTRLAFAAALVLLFGMGAYAASGLVYEEFRLQLPGARGPVYGEQLGLQQTANGVRVSLEWAYADSRNVVVGYKVEDLEGNRRVAGRPAELQATAVNQGGHGNDARRFAERFPNRVVLTDESGTYFAGAGGQSTGSATLQPLKETPTSGVFAPEKAIEPDGKHRFRLEIPVEAQALPSYSPSEPVGEPFVFDFEIPVRPAPTIELDQEVEADGVALTLERVVNSPARPQAFFCLKDPPLDGYFWSPVVESPGEDGLMLGGGPVAGKGYCAEVLLADRLESRSSLTVTKLEGGPLGHNVHGLKTIRGPWTFEFEAPNP